MPSCIFALFCSIDDFCHLYKACEKNFLIEDNKKRQRDGKLVLSEMLFIMILFHATPFKNFKSFYNYGVCGHYRWCFKEIPSYEQFVALMPRLMLPLTLIMHSLQGTKTGIYFVDSTKIAVCHNKRISRNRVFKGLAARGKTSMGWFYGFKIHMVINHLGEIMAIKITRGNTHDIAVIDDISRNLKGDIYADKGYISKKAFLDLWKRGLKLITAIRKNMKNYLMLWIEKIMLRRRCIIETVFSRLKQSMNIEHTRHRSPVNAFVHILSCLAAYILTVPKAAVNMVIPYP